MSCNCSQFLAHYVKFLRNFVSKIDSRYLDRTSLEATSACSEISFTAQRIVTTRSYSEIPRIATSASDVRDFASTAKDRFPPPNTLRFLMPQRVFPFKFRLHKNATTPPVRELMSPEDLMPPLFATYLIRHLYDPFPIIPFSHGYYKCAAGVPITWEALLVTSTSAGHIESKNKVAVLA